MRVLDAWFKFCQSRIVNSANFSKNQNILIFWRWETERNKLQLCVDK